MLVATEEKNAKPVLYSRLQVLLNGIMKVVCAIRHPSNFYVTVAISVTRGHGQIVSIREIGLPRAPARPVQWPARKRFSRAGGERREGS